MIKVSVSDAPGRLQELLEKLQRGEDIVLLRDGEPVVRVSGGTPFEPPTPEESLSDFIQRRRESLGLSLAPPPAPEDFDLPTHEDDWMDNPRDPLNEEFYGR